MKSNPKLDAFLKLAGAKLLEAGKGMGGLTQALLQSSRARRMVVGGVVLGFAGYGFVQLPNHVQSVAPGEIAIRVNQLSGTAQILNEGWALCLPQVHRMVRYSLKDQIYKPVGSARASDPSPFQSTEGLSIGVDLSVRYALDAAQVPAMLARLPENIGQELVEPVIDGVLRKHFARHTVREIFSSQRAEIQKEIAEEITPLLLQDGVKVKSVMIGNVDLPAQYRRGVEALLAEELNAEQMRYTLELKSKQVKQSELEAEADKIKREKAAEAAGSEEIIAAKSKAEAMRHILPFKEKEIEQKRLEAEAAKVSRLTQATAEAEAHRIEASGEADARRKLAESDAYRVEVTGKAASEQLARDAELISRNPLLIQKTMADKLSDKIQVIIAPPQAGGFIAGGLLGQMGDSRVAKTSSTSQTVQAQAATPSEEN